jgi:hypothetical protein
MWLPLHSTYATAINFFASALPCGYYDLPVNWKPVGELLALFLPFAIFPE